MGFRLEHKRKRGENLAFCNSRQKILPAFDLEEDLEAILRGSTEPGESKLNHRTHSCYARISFHSHNYLPLMLGSENILDLVCKD